jgi:DICT domain-containing protein
MWESRHGFPSPARLPGGHRRYAEADVALVQDIARLREQGLSMAAAIERVARTHRPVRASMFAGMRERHPEVSTTVLPKPAVLSLSHAIEDEYCARASGGLLFGCFQREHFYRQAERRWRELARTADLAVVLAEFAAVREPAGAPIEIPFEPDQPLRREWVVVVDGPSAHACLAAWEQPSQTEVPDLRRRFEVLWSFEPSVVRSASDVAIGLLRRLAPTIAERQPPALLDPPRASSAELRFAAALAVRMVGYVAHMLEDVDPGG